MQRALRQGLLPSATATAAYLVHQTRYLIAPDASANREHGYLAMAPELLTLLLALSVGWALRETLRHGTGPVAAPTRPVARWLLCTAALVVVFAGQELAEGHVQVLLGASGLSVVPLSAFWALALCWLAPRARQAIVAIAARLARRRRTWPRASAHADGRRPSQVLMPRGPVLAGGAAGRAPPRATGL